MASCTSSWRRGGHIARICGVSAYLSRAVPGKPDCPLFEAYGDPGARLVPGPIPGMTWWVREKPRTKRLQISKKSGKAKGWPPICIQVLPGKAGLNRSGLLRRSPLLLPNLRLLRPLLRQQVPRLRRQHLLHLRRLPKSLRPRLQQHLRQPPRLLQPKRRPSFSRHQFLGS